jgi:hypothetical protein
MARIRIDDLPILEDLGQEELQGIYGEGLFSGQRLRQVAAAATLGITLASAPFAVAGNQGRGGQGGGQGGRPGNSPGPARTTVQVHSSRTSGHSGIGIFVGTRGGTHTVQAACHTPPSHSQQSYARGGWQGNGGRQYFEHVGSYCQDHGTRFSHGFYYVGRIQKHFTERWWDERYETYLYFDPHAHCPYYWCEAHGVFYPIQYIETVGPNAKGPGPVGIGGQGGAPLGGAPVGGAPQGGGAPAGNGPALGGQAGGAEGGPPAGGAQGGGVQGGGAQLGGAQGAGAQGSGAQGSGAQGSGAQGSGAQGSGAQEGGAPAEDGSAEGAATGVAQKGAPAAKKEVQQVPPGTFDGAIPDEPN